MEVSEVWTLYKRDGDDASRNRKLGHSPNSNTLNVHYKGRRTSEVDREASDHLAGMILPLIDQRRA